MNSDCRACGRPVPSRSRRSCQYCGAPLAEAEQLRGKRAAFLQQLKADETKRHRQFMERDVSTGGSPGLPHFPGM